MKFDILSGDTLVRAFLSSGFIKFVYKKVNSQIDI